MDIVILAGGLSPERDVSLSSGCKTANALMECGHKVLLIDVFEGIDEAMDFDMAWQRYNKSRYQYQVPEIEPDLEKLKRESNNNGAMIGIGVIEVCRSADVVFIALHGSIGENGQLQGMFDLLNIKYTGSGYEGSMKAMDKILSKQIMELHQIKTPRWCSYSDITKGRIDWFFPCVIKPNSCGSSIGVSIVESKAELDDALYQAQKYEDQLLVEEKITGREFSVGILEGKALPVIEIIPKAGFYDYKNKYQAEASTEICPAHISDASRNKLQSLALEVHNALGLGSYSRVDFLMDETGEFYCLEANTLPGMTPTSLLPQEALADGISYTQLCRRIIETAAL